MSSIETTAGFFRNLNQPQVTFRPPVRIKYTPHSAPLFVDELIEVKGEILATISNTKNEKFRKKIEHLSADEINSVNIRLYDMNTRNKIA